MKELLPPERVQRTIPPVVVFLVDRLRNVLALRKLRGPTRSGMLCSDRWRAYDELPVLQRQVC